MAQRLKTDWLLFLTVLTLVCFGLVMVYSSSSIVAELKYHVSSTHFFLRQLGWAIFSFLVLLYCMKRDYRGWNDPKIAFAGLGIVLLLLLAVYVTDSGSHRWLRAGPFSLQPSELAGLTWDMVQGTNLQHALMLASRHLAKHPDAEPVVMVVTDGEPTAHLLSDGSAWFDWPTHPETLAVTMAEVERITRRGATINVFMLDDEPGLVHFVESVARRNGGRVFSADADRLGEYVVSDYIRARRGRSAHV